MGKVILPDLPDRWTYPKAGLQAKAKQLFHPAAPAPASGGGGIPHQVTIRKVFGLAKSQIGRRPKKKPLSKLKGCVKVGTDLLSHVLPQYHRLWRA